MFASTHLSTKTALRYRQLEWLYRQEKENDPDRPIDKHPLWPYGTAVLVGDFNAEPTDDDMRWFFWEEVGDTSIGAGEPYGRVPNAPDTHQTEGKIDYLMNWDMRGNRAWRNPSIVDSRNSDHHHHQAELLIDPIA